MTNYSSELLELAEAAPEYVPEQVTLPHNRAMPLRDFMREPRPTLQYHIKGMLPFGGKMTISAQAKGFKTTLLIEMGLCAAVGNVSYLDFEFGEPVRTLFVDPELSDGLRAERLSWIGRTAPEWIDKKLAAQNFHVLETAHGRPSLWAEHPRCAQSRLELEQAIANLDIKILLVDSLYMTFAGMDENAANNMTMALDYLGDLANRFGVAIILTHHFNKSGTGARGSSVYQGWGESDLSISRVDNAPDVVKVDALLRCAFPKGFPAFWRKPDENTAWFERVPEGWSPEKPGRKAKVTPQLAVMVLRDCGRALKYGEYVQTLKEAAGCGRSAATDAISQAVSEGAVIKGAGLYALPQKHQPPSPGIQLGLFGHSDSDAGS